MKSINASTFFRMLTAPAVASSKILCQEGNFGCLKIALCRTLLLNYPTKYPDSHQFRTFLQQLSVLLLSVFLMIPASAFSQESDWSVGGYGGQYYDSEPAGFSQGKANYLNQYIVALTASKTVWRSESLPLSMEMDGMVGYQFGFASLYEIAIAPVLRWSSFPWKETLQTDLRVGPLGVSYTTSVSPLERGTNGNGSHILNFLLIELAFSLPREKSEEVFLRLHHRCTIYDLLNNYGANGEDFFALGYRHYF